MTDFASIARDLETCDLINAIGDQKSRKIAAKHRKACFNAIKDANKSDGLCDMSDDELLSALIS